MVITEAEVLERLATVMDPEIPAVSITDLGIVERVAIGADAIEVDLLPTFSGCPALDVIRGDVERALAGDRPVRVRFVNAPAWTTDRISERGRTALGSYGISPPLLQIGTKPVCPFCGSANTVEESAFGPTLCRTIRYCNACRNPFEGFKRKG